MVYGDGAHGSTLDRPEMNAINSWLDQEHKGQQLVRGYNEAHNRLGHGAYEASEALHDRGPRLWPELSPAA